jgi:hypothetical protein
VAALAACLISAGVCSCALAKPRSATNPEVIQAKSLEIVDSRGVVRIRLKVSEYGPEPEDHSAVIELTDQDGVALLTIMSGGTPTKPPPSWGDHKPRLKGPYIAMESVEHGTGVVMWLSQGENQARGITVYSPDQSSTINLLADTTGKPRLEPKTME